MRFPAIVAFVAANSVTDTPEAVSELRVPTFLFASRTTALLAAAVPSVMPSSFSRSVSLRSAEPITKLVPAVTEPPAVIAPAAATTEPETVSSAVIEPPAVMLPPADKRPAAETIEPEMVPSAVRLLRLAMFLLASRTRALDAAPVPLVMPSSFSMSASLRSAEPMIKLPTAVTEPPKEATPVLLTVDVPPPRLKFSKEPWPEPETVTPTRADALKFLRPDTMSPPASSTRALFAAPAPLVMPSSFSRSVSLRSAEPIMKLVPAVTEPAATSREPETVSSAVIEPPAVMLPPADKRPAEETIEPEIVFATVSAPALSKLVLALKVRPVPSSTAKPTPPPEPEAKSIF